MSSLASTTGIIVSGLGVLAGYSIYFWRVFRSQRGNKLVECGVITLIAFFALAPFTRTPGFDHIPDWIFLPYLLLLVLLCLTTLYFLVQRIRRALKHGKED